MCGKCYEQSKKSGVTNCPYCKDQLTQIQ
ncbi:MAG: hypothetical protein JSV04_00910 [Candidatus Heimdallarchaeota archaeon]|nr:MAG: hypothetical protein JSV04_00910 [Candidatus Heimdallarchaeota archaeon]